MKLFALLLAAMVTSAHAIAPGFINTFSTGLDDWQKGQVNPTYLSVPTTGGPAGTGDAYMESVADGAGSFGRLTVFNSAEWSTDFIADGVTSVKMDLLPAAVPLEIRLALRLGGNIGYISSSAFTLAPGGTWQSASFSLAAADMTAVGAPGSYNDVLSAANFQFRILNAASTSNVRGDAVSATLGIDNIEAIPEPATWGLLVLGAGVCAAAARRRR